MFPRITPLHAAGSSLLEVLIALILLSLGMLGMISLQVTSLKSNQSAMTRSLSDRINSRNQ
jgi:type IV pilus assembly protein PilV